MRYPDPFLSLEFHRSQFIQNMDSAERLFRSAHHVEETSIIDGPDSDLAKQVRGLVLVLLFASSERLIKSMNSSILEAANLCQVSFGRLKPHIKHYALVDSFRSLLDSPPKKFHSDSIPEFLSQINQSKKNWVINPNTFPDTKTFMDDYQLEVWWKTVGLTGSYKSSLRESNNDFIAVRKARNRIAHGEATSEEVGRGYTSGEIHNLLIKWKANWLNLIDEVERQCSTIDFYRD